MSTEVAYRSSHHEVVAKWHGFLVHKAEVAARRRAVQDKYGRALMIRRDWGHGNRACGFVKGDEPFGEKAFKVVNYSRLEPRMSTKGGKAVAAELAELNQDGVEFPGMQQWFIGGDAGLRILAPSIFEHEGAIWLYWPAEPDGVDADVWEKQPLSAYYAAKEALDAAEDGAA